MYIGPICFNFSKSLVQTDLYFVKQITEVYFNTVHTLNVGGNNPALLEFGMEFVY